MTTEGQRTSKKHRGLAAILKRFPEDRDVLQLIYQTSTNFRSLCADYEEGLGAFRRWQQATSKEAAVMRGIYTVLLQELEQEVEECLKPGMVAHDYPGE